MIATILCLVAGVHDGDTLRCADNTRIRLAGVNAREIHGKPCPRGRPCPAMPARQARAVLSRMVLGKTIRCTPRGYSYQRIVASCTIGGEDLRCSLLRAGAVAEWARYSRGLGRCGR